MQKKYLVSKPSWLTNKIFSRFSLWWWWSSWGGGQVIYDSDDADAAAEDDDGDVWGLCPQQRWLALVECTVAQRMLLKIVGMRRMMKIIDPGSLDQKQVGPTERPTFCSSDFGNDSDKKDSIVFHLFENNINTAFHEELFGACAINLQGWLYY